MDSLPPSSRVLIIGGGIAGSLTARALADQGIASTVVDARPEPKVPQDPGNQIRGALYVRLGVDYSPETRFSHTALSYALERYGELQQRHPETSFLHGTGLLQLGWNEREAQRQSKFLERNQYSREMVRPVDATQASELTGLKLTSPGLWFPRCGYLFPARLCQAALRHPSIETQFATRIVSMDTYSREGGCSVTTEQGESRVYARVVIASGHQSLEFLPESIPLRPVRGQITFLPATTEQVPRAVICGGGYALPPCGGTQIIGATFDRDDMDPQPREQCNRQNLERLREWLPALGNQWEGDAICQAGVGFRAVLPDHLPVAGLADTNSALYALTGLGSKGLAYAPVLAEHLACLMTGAPSPLDDDLANRLSPTRFHRNCDATA